MTVVGYSTLEVIPSVKGLARSLEKQTSGDLTTAGKRGGKRFGDAAGTEAAAGFKGKFSGALKGYSPLAGLAIGAGVTALFKDAISGASDLQESTSKVNVVFGEAAASVRKFGADASSSIGQSEAQALSAVGTFGNLLRAVGLSEEASAKLSTSMVQLGSDLASFNNTSIDDALEALRSGLVGETEPLKRFGVNMNEAVLKAKALELGLSDGKAVLDANAKAQAAYAVIMEQTSLAQGDFARTSDGLANKQKTLAAQWSEMTTALGQELLPAATELVGFLSDKGVPALGATGGAVKETVQAVSALPPPVLAAAAAFAALRIASRTGLTDAIGGGVTSTTTALGGLRDRLNEGRAAYLRAGQASITMSGQAHVASLGVGRLQASMIGVKTASAGAGTALKNGLGKASALVGGPWGAAFIAGTVILTKFWQNQQESKARVESLTAALDKQTGSITKQAEEVAFKNLQDAGAIDTAKELGISLDLIREAALGNADALAKVNDELTRQQAAFNASTPAVKGAEDARARFSIGITHLREALGQQNTELTKARDGIKDYASFSSEASGATRAAAGSFMTYKQRIAEVRTELQKLLEKEKERALNAIQTRRDNIALRETLRAAREEAAKGKDVLFDNSKAADTNMSALLDLANQWATSTPKVQNARGAYVQMRQSFIEVATQMGATKKEATNLANELLKVPKTAPVRFQSEGYQQTLAEIQRIRREAQTLERTFRLIYTTQATNQQGAAADRKYASGGMIFGRGTGTSDSNLIWASKGEFMQRKAAVDYYGVEFMRRLNNLQIPKFAQGGPIAAPVMASAGPSAPLIDMRGAVIQPQNFQGFMTDLQRRTRDAQAGGAPV